MIRDVRRINGRAPRERDKKDRAGCTDPNPLSPEPLAFLLPAHRDEYRFTSLRDGKENDRAALIIDFMSANRTSRPELIEDERGHDDCFDWSGPVATRGRVWVDARQHDVLRVDRHIDGPVDVRVPWRLQRRYNFEPWVVLERDDQTMRYKAVAFSDPDEVMRLPESIESLTVVRDGLQSVRRTETFSELPPLPDRGPGRQRSLRPWIMRARDGRRARRVLRRRRSTDRAPRNGVSLMVPHRSRSNRTLPVLGLTLVLAATLPSCGRGADAPPASNRAAADTPHRRPHRRHRPRRRASSPGAGRST